MFCKCLIEAGKSCQFIFVLCVLNVVSLATQGQSIIVSETNGVIAACESSPSEDPFLQRFTFSATGLTTPVSVQAPAGFEISRSVGSGYGAILNVGSEAGSIATTTIFVRAKASAISGTISGTVALSSTGAMSRNVFVSGNIYTRPTLNSISNQVVRSGALTNAINFSSTPGAATYNWSNSTPSIGLPASGQGYIPSFTATNPGTTPVVATITVTPVVTSFAYVPLASDEISVINTVTKEPVTSIAVGSDPYGISVSPDGNKVFVTNSGSHNVSVISTSTHEVIGTIPVGDSPSGIVTSPDGSRVYVVNTISGSVSVIDALSHTVITTIAVSALLPEAIASNGDGTRLYVIGGDKMSVISTTSNSEIASLLLGSVLTSLKAVAVSSSTGRIYVVDGGFSMNAVYVIDPVTHALVTTINPGQNPAGIAISPDGKTGYVSARDSRQVAFINLATNAMTAPVTVGWSPVSLSLSPDGLWLYAVSEFGGFIYVINTSTRVVSGTMAVSTSLLGNFISGGIGCEGDGKSFTITVTPTPTVTVSPVRGVIMACEGSPSASPLIQQFSISGLAILSDVTLAAPAHFEISTLPDGGYGSTITLNPTAGAIPETTIYVRSAAGVTAQIISDYISISTTEAEPKLVAVRGVVNALPVLDPVSDHSFTTDSLTDEIVFSGTANTFYWTNSNPAIGIPASGTGNIPSFVGTGAENSPIEATIEVSPSSRSYAYIPHEGSGSDSRMILVVDLSINIVVDTIPLEFYPMSILVSADKKWVYVTASTSRGLAVVNTHTNTIHKTIEMPGLGVDMVLSPNGDKLYVAQRIPDKISIFSTITNTLERTINLDPEPRAIEISADGSKLYVTSMTSQPGGAFVIEEATGQSISGISDIGSSAPGDMVKNSSGTLLYICNLESNTITVANTATNSVITRIAVSEPSTLTISPDDQFIYVASAQLDRVVVIDASSNSVVKTIPVGNEPQGVEVSADGRFVYVPNYGSGTLSVISTATHAVTSTIPMAFRPTARGKFIVNGTGCEGSDYSFKIIINPVPPTIRVSKASGKVDICQGAPSETSLPKEFSVSGLKLVSPVTVNAPDHLEVSTLPGGTYASELTLSPVSGELGTTKIYVRARSSAPEGISTYDVVLTATGAVAKSVSVTVIGHSLPVLDAVGDVSFVSGSETEPIQFSGTGSTLDFIWSNSTTAIGLPGNGRGGIPSFTPANAGTTPITATIQMAPKSVSMAFISNGGSDDVSVVNTDTKKEMTRVPVLDFPTVVAITPTGDKVYVANCIVGEVSVISTKDYSVIGTIQVGPYANGILMNNSGTLVYVYSDEDGMTSIIDTETDRVIKTVPEGSRLMAISPDDKYLYTLRYYTSGNGLQIVKLDAQTLRLVAFANIGKYSSHGMAIGISPDGETLYVTTAKESVPRNPSFPMEDHVTVIHTETLAIVKSIPVWQVDTDHLELSKDGAFVYVLNIRGELVTISTSSLSVISQMPTVGQALPFGVHNHHVYLVNSSYNTNDPTAPAGNLRILDMGTASELAKIYLGRSPGVLGSFISQSTGCTGENQSFTITVYPEGYSLPEIQTGEVIGTIVTCAGVESSGANVQQFTVSGARLNEPIFLSAPENFEISVSSQSNFAESLSISHSGGSVPGTVIYVRLKADARAGLNTGNVLAASAGANFREVFVNGFVSSADLQSASIPPATINEPYSYTIPGSFVGFSVSATGLPQGFSIDDNGTINGTATAIASIPVEFTVTATNGMCAESATYSLAIEKTNVSLLVPAISLVYDGQPKSVSSLISPSGHTMTVTYNGSTDLPVRAGTYTVVATLTESSYSGTGTGTLTISKASLTASADNVTRYYGVNNPPFTIAYSGFVNSETVDVIDIQPTASVTANAASNAGDYSITLSGGADDNYAISLESGILTVLQADQALTFDEIGNKIATDKPFAITASSSAGLPIIFEVVSGPAKVSGNMVSLSGAAGTVVVRAIQSGDINFEAAAAERSFSVSQVDQVIAFESIGDKLATDEPFSVTAFSSVALPIVFSIVSGPATILGNVISLSGESGTVIVRASQSGTNSIKPAIAERSFSVSMLDQVLTFESIGDKLATDQPFTITAFSSAGLTVVFSIISGPAQVTGNVITLTGETGTVNVRASQSGTNSIKPAIAEQSFLVTASDQVLTFAAIGNKLSTDEPFAITASSSAGLPILFSIVSGPATISGNIITLNGDAGTVIVRATQSGTVSVKAAMAETSFVVDLVLATEPSYLDNISAYPKPVRTVLIVEHASGIRAEAIGFLDGLGRVVDLPVKQINAMRVELNASEIPAGLYYVRIRSGSKDRFIKIPVTH